MKMAGLKTVYILGAGASVSAKLPTQAGIISLVFSLDRSSFNTTQENGDFLSLNINESEEKLQLFYPEFDKYRRELGQFIVSNFATSDKSAQYSIAIRQADMITGESAELLLEKDEMLKQAYNIIKSINVSLEDLFTIFDSIAAGREHFRLYSPQRMAEMHNKLKMCIIYAMSFSIATVCDESDYTCFSQYLLSQRLLSSQKEDNLSVITMNWDDIFERSLYKLCESYNKKTTKKQQKVYPDLCFYNYDYHFKPDHIPSVHIKAKGNKNIKILKMHGSLAWLECPRCGRIFTDFKDEIAYEEFGNTYCRFCTNDADIGDLPILRSLIITPTFMKSLDNLNIKNIWHNAYIDVNEADHLVFIGYSFPDADFEMRCLLKKAVKSTANITVVLSQYDDPKEIRNMLKNSGCTDELIKQIIEKMSLPFSRYSSFFGEDKIEFFYGGFNEYLKHLGE